MTIEQLDTLFPNRRDECVKAGLNPDLPIIPNACVFAMNAIQVNAVFPNARTALPRLLKRALEVAEANEAQQDPESISRTPAN